MRHPSRDRLSAALALILATSFAAPVMAQKNTGDKTYKEALKLELSGNYAAALSVWESIAEGKRLPATRMHIAKCKSGLGRMLAAETDLIALVADPKIDEAERETAKGDLELLRSKMPKLTLTLATSAVGSKVTLDGQELTLPATRALDPGVHHVLATKGLKEVYRRDVTLEEGRTINVEIDDPTATATKVDSATTTPLVTTTNSNATKDAVAVEPRSSRGAAPIVALALGGVFIGGFVVGQLLASKNADDLKTTCAGQGTLACHDDDDKKSAVHKWETVSFVSAGLAAVSIGVGVYLLAKSPSKTESKTGLEELRLGVGAGTVALSGAF